MKVAIIGAGEIGRAVAYLLEKNGHVPVFFDKDPLRSSGNIETALIGAEIVFFCVPSWGLREALLSAVPHMGGTEILVFVSKGLEPETGLNAMEIAASAAPGLRSAFVGGPMLAEEIISGKGGASVVAAYDRGVMERIRVVLASKDFFAAVSEDVPGVVFSGVLKNIYALLLGSVEGLGYGVNIKGLLIVKAVAEMRVVVVELGGEGDTAIGMSGLGDLFATGSGSFSNNWKAGFSLAKGMRPEKISEAMSSFSGLSSRLDISAFGLLSAAGDIILKNDNDKLRRIFES